MKLTKIQIANFRCFESLKLELQPDVNILVGVNGAGKTTILDAVAMALYDIVAANGAGGKRQRSAQLASLKETDIHVVPGKNPLEGRKDHVLISASARDFYPVGHFSETALDGSERLLEWDNFISYSGPTGFHYENGSSERLATIYTYFHELWKEIRSQPEALIPLPVVAFYRSDRRFRATSKTTDFLSGSTERNIAYQMALHAGQSFNDAQEWFYLRENTELRERQQQGKDTDFQFPDLRAVREAVRRCVDNVANIFFIENKLAVSLVTAKGTPSELLLEQLSDGYQNLLSIVFDYARRLAQANPHFPEPLNAPGILLIDEIELHLHPGWQQTVVPQLQRTFPNTQLIITTHSPQVLSTVRSENVHFIDDFHVIQPLPDDVGTLGAESSRIMQEVFGVHTRPSRIQTVKNLTQYLTLVEQGQYDSETASALRRELEEDLGKHDPDLLTADVRAKQLAVLGNR